MKNVIIELTPHDALAITSFLQEFEKQLDIPVCESLVTAIKNYNDQVYKMSTEQFDDAVSETRMYQLLGKAPAINKNGEEQ